MRFEGGLYFVTTAVLADRLRDLMLTAEVPVEQVVLDFEAVNFVDSQGVAELDRLLRLAGERGISVRFARLRESVQDMLVTAGVIDRLGESHLHASIDGAVNAALAERRLP